MHRIFTILLEIVYKINDYTLAYELVVTFVVEMNN